MAIELREWKFNGHTPRRNDDVFGFDLLGVPVRAFDRNFSGRGDRPQAFERRYLVRFHQRTHTGINRFHDLVFAQQHLVQIDRRVFDHDPVLGCFLLGEHEMIARSQQRFAWNAADIQAGAAKLLVLLDQCGF